ncbi:MAG: disulfide bond formation protein B [Rhodospirillales bacterium]|jgi:disulfide bond formation protein DsbB|nr:disulfide bond formation protein B [Rhodospirillales bacterium]
MPDQQTIARWFPWFLLAAAAGPLGTAYIAQFGFGYDPCVLCLYQRVPYALITLLGFAALYFVTPVMRQRIALVAGVVFLVGGGIALYHVGVEQHWWTSAAPCGSSGEIITTTEDFLAALQKKPVKSCGDIDWTLFGISMATYNVAASLFFAATSFWVWRRLSGAKAS